MKKHKRISNYKKIILEKLALGEIPAIPGKVTLIDVQHDNWCDFWRGRPCNCKPDIVWTKEIENHA